MAGAYVEYVAEVIGSPRGKREIGEMPWFDRGSPGAGWALMGFWANITGHTRFFL